jgi:hypothetical protein
MTNYPYILFNKSPEQLRRLEAQSNSEAAHGVARRKNRQQRMTRTGENQ